MPFVDDTERDEFARASTASSTYEKATQESFGPDLVYRYLLLRGTHIVLEERYGAVFHKQDPKTLDSLGISTWC